MAKTRKRKARKSRRKNPGRLIITNRSRGGKGKTRSRSFVGRLFNRLAEDGKAAGAIFLGQEAGKVAEELGFRYLSGSIPKYSTPAALLIGWFAMSKFVKGTFGRYMRLGLLTRAIDYAAGQAGISPSTQLMNVLPGSSPVPTTQGTSGIGVLSNDALDTKLAGVGNPYLERYMSSY